MKILKSILYIQITFLLCGCDYSQNRNTKPSTANNTEKIREQVADESEFKRATEIYTKIVSWNATEVEMYFNLEKAVKENFITSGETNGVINELQARLFDVGYEVRWNKNDRKLELYKLASRSKENPFRKLFVIEESEYE